MRASQSDLPQLPLDLALPELVGLRDPEKGDWARLRAFQYAHLHKLSRCRAIAHALSAVIAVSLFLGDVPLIGLLLWLAAVVAAQWNLCRIDSSLANVDRRSMTRGEFRSHAIGVGGTSAIWAVPLLLFVPFGTAADQFALWTLVSMLIAGSALVMSAAPMAMIVFSAVVGAAAVASFLLRGEFTFAVATGAFVAITIGGGLNVARTFLSSRVAEASVAEKAETVSVLLREFEENEADWLWQMDGNRRIRGVSPRFAHALGRDAAEAEGKSFVELLAGSAWESGHFPASLHDLAERIKRRESFSDLLVQVEIGSERRWWEISGTPIQDENGRFAGFRGVGSDVTEQRESSEKIAFLARYDTLTGLPNRLMITEALKEALAYAEQWRSRCGFLMIDLDRFKAVNDSLGHRIGDNLLVQVSQRLQQAVGEGAMCGRLGGDEFAVVIRDASDRDKLVQLANRSIEAISKPFDVEGHKLYIGASVGSATGPGDGDTVEALMRNADLALNRAKDDGAGQHRAYEQSLHAEAEERRQLEAALRFAIDRNELSLNFQPVVDSVGEHVVAFEALLRWNSTEHGFVSPAKFIPLAEDTRLIVPIGEWVMREACRQAVAWPDRLKVSVNVSGEQLLEPGFATTVVKALADSGLPARRLEVEVTESIFVRDAQVARQALEEIIALGCSVALDDFGTGYSSLGYLRAIRFSTIKVDRSFVQGAAQGSRESLAIIRAVVAMSDSLEMTTTAEGVETASEAAMIRDMGCTKIQGYYFGRPMPAAEALALAQRCLPGRAAA
ncbi:EAL domain-containing protein [Altererythrobacter soli]|uniref:EAL domain-containing protein n=1 Tax=Croceibacterium soli TaxID=1739690 RepID=A0A6I4UYI6_9SPHN|nr:GGDEF and EAL domain-containing protein [Croceibacterium soli]MXP42663.1 EAL domain-containing protein [Croceibacterium soli]